MPHLAPAWRIARRRLAAMAVVLATACDDTPSVGEGDLVARGQEVFGRCRACHVVEGDERRAGPTLEGVIGRPAGTVEGFDYSGAMRNSGIVWDEATLAQFLHDPRRTVPDNRMFFAGLRRDSDIAAVIAYLKAATGGDAADLPPSPDMPADQPASR